MKEAYIVGIDEVGRGPVAGPVAVGSFVCLMINYELLITNGIQETGIQLRDSKKLSKKQREKWFEYLKSEKEKGNCDFAVSVVSADQIDKFGIVPSIQKALNSSLSKVASQAYKNFRALPLGGIKNELLHSLSGSRSQIADVSLRAGDKGRHAENFQNPTSLSIYLDGGLKAPAEYTNQETIIKGDELHPIISCASIIAKVTRDNLMAKYALEYPNYGFENHVGYGTRAHYLAIQTHGLTPLHRKTFLKNL